MNNLIGGLKKIVYISLFAVLLPLSAYICYGALDDLRYANALTGVLHGKMIPVFTAGISFLLLLLFARLLEKLLPVLEKHEKRAVGILFLLLILGQLLLIFLVPVSFRYDHLKIFDTAAALLDAPTIKETHFDHYFMKYPNNIPMCLFTYFWMKAASVCHIPRGWFMGLAKLINLLFMNLGMWFSWSLLRRHRSARAGLTLLILTLVNPLWYLLVQMYYTSTITLAFSMGAIWLFDRASEESVLWKKYLMYLGMGVLLACGFKIRATLIITMAALLIYGALRLKRLDLSKEALSLLAAAAGVALIFAAYGKIEAHYAGFDPAKTGYPAVHWVMMSAQNDGQYNSVDDLYTGSFETKKERTEADLTLLKERIRDMGPKGLVRLWKNKLRVTFADGTDDYYSLFRTMRKTSPAQKYINGGRSDYLALYLHSYHGLLTALVLAAFLLRAKRKERDLLDVTALNICGAYLFYLIWEVDHAYSIPFMLLLLMWAAVSMEEAASFIGNVYPEDKKIRLGICFIPAAALFLAAASTVIIVHRSGIPVREYVVLQDQESSGSLVLQTHFEQTFRADRPFDHIDLWVANWDGPANDSIYDLTIEDESKNVVASAEIVGNAAPCMDSYTVSFDKIIPKGNETYRICVHTRTPEAALPLDFLYYQTDNWDMYPDGSLYGPDEIKNVDLAFAVYEEK